MTNPAPNATLHDLILPAPFGAIGVRCDDALISRIEFLPPGSPLRAAQTPLAKEAARQLSRFLETPDQRIDLPLKPCGSAFAQGVWAALRSLAPGQTCCYGELAKALKTSARAVGQACAANPYPLVIPCHRVVAAVGPGGFHHARDGFFLEVKRWLLKHERCAD